MPEFLVKIKAAVDARHDEDFTVLARTDALACAGLDAAVDPAHLAVEVGADWVFIEAPEDLGRCAGPPRRSPCPHRPT